MRAALAILCFALLAQPASADFVENFRAPLVLDPAAHHGWAAFAGSGDATVTFTRKNGHGIMEVDARRDRRNIWWAVIKHAVSDSIDRSRLGRPGTALRVEVKLRLNAAPRRINLSFNHTRTTDFDRNLMEFDIPDTGWHVISFTAKGFDATPNDDVFVQLAMMDEGRDVYRAELAYLKVSVVDPARAGPDLGAPMPYRPPLKPLSSYANAVPAAQDGIVDAAYPWVNYKSWANMTGGTAPVLAVSGTMMSLLRFDLAKFKEREPDGWGVLVLTTDSVQWAPTNLEEFGYVRVVEIKGGPTDWTRDTLTRDAFFAGKADLDVLNGQLIVDVPPAIHRGEQTMVRINPAVLKRLLSGETRGLALYAQGEVYYSFASRQSPNPSDRPMLYFSLK